MGLWTRLKVFMGVDEELANVEAICARMRQRLQAQPRPTGASFMDEQGRLCRRLANGEVVVVNSTPLPFSG
ncbi:MAG: hypothetical protein HYR84_00945 [Planctomycetes bacterium]|nr:hypothetical protein [Planctomycetota bacterium]